MKPTVPEVLPFMREYAALSGNSVGGSFHIVLDDGNVSDSDVEFCIQSAQQKGDTKGIELGELLLKMSKTQRKKLAGLFYQ